MRDNHNAFFRGFDRPPAYIRNFAYPPYDKLPWLFYAFNRKLNAFSAPDRFYRQLLPPESVEYFRRRCAALLQFKQVELYIIRIIIIGLLSLSPVAMTEFCFTSMGMLIYPCFIKPGKRK